jgi:beta-galactosidase/beta-glucuronidase
VNYPFPVDPPNVPYDDNECGRYVTTFAVPEHLRDGRQWRLRFEGVDSSFTVWVNGKNVGYSQGSRNPSEFDVTSYLDLDSEENYLAVEVYQRCDGSYIEDQVGWLSFVLFLVSLNMAGSMVVKRHLSRCLATLIPVNPHRGLPHSYYTRQRL